MVEKVFPEFEGSFSLATQGGEFTYRVDDVGVLCCRSDDMSQVWAFDFAELSESPPAISASLHVTKEFIYCCSQHKDGEGAISKLCQLPLATTGRAVGGKGTLVDTLNCDPADLLTFGRAEGDEFSLWTRTPKLKRRFVRTYSAAAHQPLWQVGLARDVSRVIGPIAGEIHTVSAAGLIVTLAAESGEKKAELTIDSKGHAVESAIWDELCVIGERFLLAGHTAEQYVFALCDRHGWIIHSVSIPIADCHDAVALKRARADEEDTFTFYQNVAHVVMMRQGDTLSRGGEFWIGVGGDGYDQAGGGGSSAMLKLRSSDLSLIEVFPLPVHAITSMEVIDDSHLLVLGTWGGACVCS